MHRTWSRKHTGKRFRNWTHTKVTSSSNRGFIVYQRSFESKNVRYSDRIEEFAHTEPSQTPESITISNDIASGMRNEIGRCLKKKRREVIELTLDTHSNEEISAELNIENRRVRVAGSQARTALRKHMDKRWVQETGYVSMDVLNV